MLAVFTYLQGKFDLEHDAEALDNHKSAIVYVIAGL
jgi:hypothetical protein